VSPRHQNAKNGNKIAIFASPRQIDLKNGQLGCRRDTRMDRRTGKIFPKRRKMSPDIQNQWDFPTFGSRQGRFQIFG
jgi:hypothetical protein